jgi:cell division septation protein DedD
MKENRFIELLNLYIDRQITAAETAELEAELQSNPKRQAVYRQYCQIHTATKQVYASFRASSADSPVTEPGQTGVIELFESRRRRSNWVHYVGGAAAAACLAVLFVRFNSTGSVEAPQVAVQPQPAVVAPVQIAAAPAPVKAEPAPTVINLRDTTAISPDYMAMLAALREQDEERAFSNERLNIGRIQPLFDDNLFEAARILSTQEQRVFRSFQPASARQTEAAAFQFQR